MNNSQKIKYCEVKNCRYNDTHTTIGHKCGKCKHHGHGERECNNYYLKKNLEQFFLTKLPNEIQCKFSGCKYKEYHTSDAHQCSSCNKFYHSKETCSKNSNIESEIKIKIICPICKKINEYSSNQIKIYGSEEICCVCLSNKIEVFFPNCGHACICLECSNNLNQNKQKINIINEEELIRIFCIQNIDYLSGYLKPYPSYISIDENMGCKTLIRRLNPSSKLEGIYINPDLYDESYILYYNNFIKGYFCAK